MHSKDLQEHYAVSKHLSLSFSERESCLNVEYVKSTLELLMKIKKNIHPVEIRFMIICLTEQRSHI